MHRMQTIRPCVAATVRRDLKAPSGTDRKVTRGTSKFPIAPFLVADISCGRSFYSPVKSDDSGRDTREEIAVSTGDKGPSLFVKSGPTALPGRQTKPQQETLADSDTSHRRPGVGAIQATATGRLVDADFGLPARHRTRGVSGERLHGVDDVSVLRSPLELDDGSDIQVKKGLAVTQPHSAPPCPGCASTMQLQLGEPSRERRHSHSLLRGSRCHSW